MGSGVVGQGVPGGYVGKAEAKRRKVNHSESDSDRDDILPRTDRQKAATVSKRERLSKPTDLLILGLPPSIEDETVRNYLETFGPVKLLNVCLFDTFGFKQMKIITEFID